MFCAGFSHTTASCCLTLAALAWPQCTSAFAHCSLESDDRSRAYRRAGTAAPPKHKHHVLTTSVPPPVRRLPEAPRRNPPAEPNAVTRRDRGIRLARSNPHRSTWATANTRAECGVSSTNLTVSHPALSSGHMRNSAQHYTTQQRGACKLFAVWASGEPLSRRILSYLILIPMYRSTIVHYWFRSTVRYL